MKLYICQTELGELITHTRTEVDLIIERAEEFDGAMPFTVLGSVDTEEGGTPFLVAAKAKQNSTLYDVIRAANREDAEVLFLNKKRNKGKEIEVKLIRDITKVVTG